MAKRKKIGIHYVYNENWIGGTYYIENLISALNHLPDERKPELIVFTNKAEDYARLINSVRYPYLSQGSYLKTLTIPQRIANKLSRTLFTKNIFSSHHTDLALVFPAENENKFQPGQRFLYWIPDFQEHYLPRFFLKEEVENRKAYQKKLVQTARYIVFSSESAKKDFNLIYTGNNVQQFVLRFAVTTPSLKNSDAVRKKYNLPERYFLCSNQFWTHKNHSVVIDALKILSNHNTPAFVAFTGKETDRRNPDYFNQLQHRVEKLRLTSQLKFLGFIDREDQLSLMSGAVAVIQPSLFEGWSTVIEDAKSMGQFVIASNLSVHKEQLKENCAFFEAADPEQLADRMKALRAPSAKKLSTGYTNNIHEFASEFMNIVDTITQDAR